MVAISTFGKIFLSLLYTYNRTRSLVHEFMHMCGGTGARIHGRLAGTGTTGGWPWAPRRELVLGSPGKGSASATTHPWFSSQPRSKGPGEVERGGDSHWAGHGRNRHWMLMPLLAPSHCVVPPLHSSSFPHRCATTSVGGWSPGKGENGSKTSPV